MMRNINDFSDILIDTNDLFENEDIVIFEAIIKHKSLIIKSIEIGLKDTDGDIINIYCLNKYEVN